MCARDLRFLVSIIISIVGCSLEVSQHVLLHPNIRLRLTCGLVADFLCLPSVQKLVTGEIILLLRLLPNLSRHFKVEHRFSQQLCELKTHHNTVQSGFSFLLFYIFGQYYTYVTLVLCFTNIYYCITGLE